MSKSRYICSSQNFKKTILSLVNDPAMPDVVTVSEFIVSDFFDIWMQVSLKSRPSDPRWMLASPGLTQQLKQMNVQPDETVLIAHDPRKWMLEVLAISPQDDSLKPLIGSEFFSEKAVQVCLPYIAAA